METTSLNISGVPVDIRAEIRLLAAQETRGIDAKMCVKLLIEALEARRAKQQGQKEG